MKEQQQQKTNRLAYCNWGQEHLSGWSKNTQNDVLANELLVNELKKRL